MKAIREKIKKKVDDLLGLKLDKMKAKIIKAAPIPKMSKTISNKASISCVSENEF